MSKRNVEKRLRKKTNPELVDTLIKLKKTNPSVAKELAKPRRLWINKNLSDLNNVEGDLLVLGKVLSVGNLDKGKKIVGWSISNKALEKIKGVKGSFVSISEEIKKNPELKNLNIVN